MWQNEAEKIISKGLTTQKAKCLADLASRRNMTQGQFWTPLWVSRKMWDIAEKAMNASSYYSVMDNSVGSGRLLAHANAEKHNLFGCDIDQRCIDALCKDAKEADFRYEFSHTGVENIEADNIGVGFVNPPFSVPISSPNLYPFTSNSYGKFGPLTNALSHEYCLAHTLKACDVSIALLPISMSETCKANKRCLAEFELPPETFKFEGANVRTAIYVFCKNHGTGIKISRPINEASIIPELNLKARSYREMKPVWRLQGIDEGKPSITLPVTGDKRVELHQKHNRIIVKYHCGLTQAKVANGLLTAPVEYSSGRGGHRYAKNVAFIGSGRFFIDSYLMQDDPMKVFSGLLDTIKQLGGEPEVSATLLGYFKKRIKRLQRDLTPFRKVVEVANTQLSEVCAKRAMMLKPMDFTSPTVKKGETLACREGDGGYYVSKNGMEVFYDKNKASKQFDFSKAIADKKNNSFSWEVVNEGKVNAFPQMATSLHARLKQCGVNFLWQPQTESVIEAMMTRGAVIGWEQGCGKARAAIALCLSSSAKHNLIAVEGGLVDEMLRELKKIGIKQSQYKVLSSLSDCMELRKINLVSYNRLKAKIDTSKRTMAHHLRRRFGVVTADEGGIISNPDSQQSRALLRLAPRKLFLLDGTPIGSYPRDLLPMATATMGAAVAHQPYSTRNVHFMSDRLVKSANYNPRGLDAFRDDFVVLDWATHEFTDNLKGGAKREIPMIGNVPKFRQWADCVVQRRLRNEPEMRMYAGCARPIRKTHSLKWDEGHFNLYIREAVEFSHWFMQEKAERAKEGKGSNLTAVLARIQAVINAANYPHVANNRKTGTYTPVTSKQRRIVERVQELISTTDDKIIIFAKNPETHNRLHKLLKDVGIDSVLFTGQQDITKRTEKMNTEFRFGACRVLLSTYVGQRGLNLEQANWILMYNRAWTGDTEEQAIARTTRPSQLKQVYAEYFHLEGSIDEYMAMVVEWKIAAARAGLDYGECSNNIQEFRHLDAVLEMFCRKTLAMSVHEYHNQLVA